MCEVIHRRTFLQLYGDRDSLTKKIAYAPKFQIESWSLIYFHTLERAIHNINYNQRPKR